MTTAFQKVPAQYSRCPTTSTRIMVWVEGDTDQVNDSLVPVLERTFEFQGDVAGNGMILCNVFPCSIDKCRSFSDTRSAVKKHYKEYHARTDIPSRTFNESFMAWAEKRRPFPLGLCPLPEPQKPMANVAIQEGYKCTAWQRDDAKSDPPCAFVSSSIAGLRSHAEKQHKCYSVCPPRPMTTAY